MKCLAREVTILSAKANNDGETATIIADGGGTRIIREVKVSQLHKYPTVGTTVPVEIRFVLPGDND